MITRQSGLCLTSNPVGDSFNLSNVPAKGAMCIVQKMEKLRELVAVHVSVLSQRKLNFWNDLIDRGPHIQQLLDKPRRRNIVKGNCVQVCAHLDKEVAVKAFVSGCNFTDYCRFPVEISNDAHEDHSHPRRDYARGLAHSIRVVRAIESLKPARILKLAFCLRRRDPAGSHDCDERTYRLGPSRPLGLIEIVANAYGYEKRRNCCNQRTELSGLIFPDYSYRYHFGILA